MLLFLIYKLRKIYNITRALHPQNHCLYALGNVGFYRIIYNMRNFYRSKDGYKV